MKAIIKRIGMLAIMLQVFLAASAYDFKVDGIYYNVVSLQDLTCEVTQGDEEYVGDIVIPSTIEYNSRKLTIVRIGSDAFYSCTDLNSVAFSEGLTTIGSYAFCRCTGLTSVVFPESLTTIGADAFYSCTGLTSVVFPESLTTIGANAFYSCTGLTSVVFPESLTTIGYDAFYSCTGLTSVAFPESLTTIGDDAFYSCTGLTSVVFPESLTTIGADAFYSCTGLTSVVFPENLTTIGAKAFFGCSGLTSVVFPENLTTIGARAFSGCSGLTSVKFEESTQQVNLEEGVFYYCNNLDYVILPLLCKMNPTETNPAGTDASINYYFRGLKYLKVGNLGCDPFRKYITQTYIGELSTGKIETMELDNVVWFSESSISKYPNTKVENLIFSENYYAEKPKLTGFVAKASFKFDLSDLKKIVSKTLEPPVIPGEVSNKNLIDVVVEVPIQALEKYQQTPVWKDFWNLKGVEGLVGIEESEVITAKEIGRYDLTGKAVSEDYRGIVIVRYSDGSTSKIVQR